MKDIAVIGEAEFTLGFALTGIRRVINPTDANTEIRPLLEDKTVGIVIIDETTMGKLDDHVKEDVVTSIEPVFVTVSATAQQEELRKMILQSIGVDLMKEE